MGEWFNQNMPYYPKGMTLWGRVRCLLGYHKWGPKEQGYRRKWERCKSLE